MFYSYKNFGIKIESFTSSGTRPDEYNSYDCIAENLIIDTNPNADFSFQIDKKTPYRGINTNGITCVLSINFINQTPNDYIFLNNILLPSGKKNNFLITCGNASFTSGYLRSFSMSIDPNDLIKNQAEFIFFGRGRNSLINGITTGFTDITGNNSYGHGSLANISFNDNANEFSDHDIRKIDIAYKADITPIYNINETYPARVIFNKEQVDLNAELDYYGLYIRNINSTIETTNINISGLSSGDNPTGIEFILKSGFLVNKNYSTKVNDVINSRISLKYFI